MTSRKNLFLSFDAFGTLFKPNLPIPQAYGQAALRHGIQCVQDPKKELTAEDFQAVGRSFRQAFKHESALHPNYGKASDLGASRWWGNVIRGTFQPFLQPSEQVSEALVSELLTRYSTKEGYEVFPDVGPFFRILRDARQQEGMWPWDKTVVGVITNSDDRVPSILESFGLTVGSRRIGNSAQQSDPMLEDADISFVILSYDVGFEKPDQRIFDAASQMLETFAGKGRCAGEDSVDTYEKLYVGDDVAKDYYGARSAGWNSLYLARGQQDGKSIERLRKDPLTSVELTVRTGDGDERKTIDACSDLMALSQWHPKEAS